MTRTAPLSFLFLLLAAGCGDEQARPTGVPDVVIETSAGGTVERLAVPADLPATFAEGDRRAWSLVALFGPQERGAGVRVEVEQADGTRVDLDRPFRPEGGHVWVLRSNRKGEAQLELASHTDPFPTFHGRGGNRGSAGAKTRQIRDVRRIRLVVGGGARAADGKKAKEQMMLQLEVVIDGESRKLDEDALVELDPIEVTGDSGEGSRDAWSVRALVRSLGGEKARLTGVRGRGDETMAVSAEAWADEDRVPLLRLNRRGRFKFHWADKDLGPTGDEAMRDVTALLIETR
jgi:hypothetical protein